MPRPASVPQYRLVSGYEIAPSLESALAMAQDTVGASPQVTAFHAPPIFVCDVE